MTPPPAEAIRRYLEGHDGHVEVPFHNLLTTWAIDKPDLAERVRIEGALGRAGVLVDPLTAELDADDMVTLIVANSPSVMPRRPVAGISSADQVDVMVPAGQPLEAPAAELLEAPTEDRGLPPGVPPVLPPDLPRPSPGDGHLDRPPLRSRLKRAWVAVPAAIALGLAVGGGVVAYLKLSDDSKERTATALRAGDDRVTHAAGLMARADKMADVKAAGQLAAKGVSPLEDQLARVNSVKDRELRKPASEALGAEIAVLQAFGHVAAAREPDRSEWNAIDKSVRQAGLTLEQVGPAVSQLHLKRVAALPAQPIAAATQNAGRVIDRGARRLARWRRHVAQVKRQKSGDLAVMEGYASSMRGYLHQWSTLRASLDDWITKVDTQGVTFQEAYDFLATASSDRGSVRQGIAALDSPPTVASAHTRLLTAIGSAIAAVDSASEGVAEYQLDFENKYSDYKDTPGWKAFREQSASVSNESSSASSTLEGLITQEKRKIERRDLPRKPEV